MISFNLVCENAHEFEAWFASGASFDAQRRDNQLSCPQCGSHKVGKGMMSPNIATGRQRETVKKTQKLAQLQTTEKEMRDAIRKVREHVEATADNVGDKFAEEARKIHYEESEKRGIYGRATAPEVKDLRDEGIDFSPLPDLPEDKN